MTLLYSSTLISTLILHALAAAPVPPHTFTSIPTGIPMMAQWWTTPVIPAAASFAPTNHGGPSLFRSPIAPGWNTMLPSPFPSAQMITSRQSVVGRQPRSRPLPKLPIKTAVPSATFPQFLVPAVPRTSVVRMNTAKRSRRRSRKGLSTAALSRSAHRKIARPTKKIRHLEARIRALEKQELKLFRLRDAEAAARRKQRAMVLARMRQ